MFNLFLKYWAGGVSKYEARNFLRFEKYRIEIRERANFRMNYRPQSPGFTWL